MRQDKLRLLIVDDEEASRYGMRRALTTFGYNVSEADSAEAARILIKQQEPDLMLLDVNLPGISGLDLLKELEDAKTSVESGEGSDSGPLVIIITAHGSERMAVEAVKSGAYDYLSKPFAVAELLARLRALLRRGLGQRAIIMRYADLELDSRNRRAKRKGSAISLSGKEFSLLELLLMRAPEAITRIEIIEHVWGVQFDLDSNLVEVYINRLRDKIDRAHQVKLIHTVRGAGYRLGLPE